MFDIDDEDIKRYLQEYEENEKELDNKCNNLFDERLDLFTTLLKKEKVFDEEKFLYSEDPSQAEEYSLLIRKLMIIAKEQNKLCGKEDYFDEDMIFCVHEEGQTALFNYNNYKFILKIINGQGTSHILFDYDFWKEKNEINDIVEIII